MSLLLFCLVVASSAGGPLSLEELTDLKEVCGKNRLGSPPLKLKSMGTNIATRYEAPFAVQLRIAPTEGTDQERMINSKDHCSGTVISNRHILTAAHCMIGAFAAATCNKANDIISYQSYVDHNLTIRAWKLDNIIVTTPTNCIDAKRCDTTLETLFARPKHAFLAKEFPLIIGCDRSSKNNGDIAIIELDKDLEFDDDLQPACINYDYLQVGRRMDMYGYGIGDPLVNEKTSGLLRKHTSWVVSEKNCEDKFEMEVYADTVCSRNNKTMACGGDSGSGQFIIKSDDRVYVSSVLVSGPPCANPEASHTFIDVNIAGTSHWKWICAVSGICEKPMSEKEKIAMKKYYFKLELSGQ